MLTTYRRLVGAAWLAACLLPAVVVIASPVQSGSTRGRASVEWSPWQRGVESLIWLAAGVALGGASLAVLNRRAEDIAALGLEQEAWCGQLPERLVMPAVVASAALSLLLELAVIRWQAGIFPLFAFYKNLSLLACFLGLGLGYALAQRELVPLGFVGGLLFGKVGVLLVTRHALDDVRRASLAGLPVTEQLAMGMRTSQTLAEFGAVYWFLAAVFLLTALLFLPLGQLCGRLMDRAAPLRGYGGNLVGSLLGVALMFAASALYLPPLAWFLLALGGLLVFQLRMRAVLPGMVGLMGVLLALAWPVDFGWEQIHSPYQLLERGPGEHGLSMVRAAGQYYQRIHNLAPAFQTDEGQRLTAAYYELPYRATPRPPRTVAVVGAGTGNDVAAALRRGVRRVDAVEIDPAIIRIGRLFHPERPYQHPNVRVIVDDARSFLRGTSELYDLIVYGLIDSHALLSHASNVRLDSFVYTVEALREARARLRPGGALALSFSVIAPELGRKLFVMLERAFDGKPPVCIQGRYSYDGSVIFLQSEGGGRLPPDEVLAEGGFRDVTSRFSDERIAVDASTDEWPFFYMPRRVYPVSYLGMVLLVLGLSVVLVLALTRERPRVADLPFSFMGAGFLLVQTKGITELSLAFGGTWVVVGVVIASMLLFAIAANAWVRRAGSVHSQGALVLVLVSLGVGLWFARAGILPGGWPGRLASAALVTCPVLFSGVVFSALLRTTEHLSRALAANLLGALCGGLLEYNSMYFGFHSLYVLAMAIFGLALLTSLFRR